MEERRDRVNEKSVFNPIHVYLRDFVTRLPSALYRAAIPTKRLFQVRGRRGADATRHRRTISFRQPRLAGWDSSVGIATGYVLDGRNLIPGRS
jgi:hypothetical protein